MSRPASPSSLSESGAAKNVPRLQPRRSRSIEKPKSYRLFPTVEPTPPATPIALQKLSLSRAGGPPRSRSVSFDSTAPLAAAQQDNAAVKSVAVRRGRKVSVPEVKHMSTVQEIPSPTVSIPYSFLPRNSEDTGHARSSSAPGEFVRDSQTLPSARIDLSKPQWTSKQADSHPAKGLGLSMPASVSADRLDQKRAPPSAKSKPNLTIEIKQDARLKPKAIIVRDDELDDDNPPPPPPKSPRHDSRNQSLNNIHYEPRKVRRTRSRTTSQSSKQSHSSPDSAHPSEEATVASQGSFVKASLVDTPSPSSSSPALSRPVIQHGREGSFSPLSGDVRIKELMATTSSEAQDDLERPIPPPITPGQPRVASMARVMSIPSLPKSVSVEKPVLRQMSDQSTTKKSGITQSDSKSTETIVPIRKVDDRTAKDEKVGKASDSGVAPKPQTVKADSQIDRAAIASPAGSSSTGKSSSARAPKPNLDKPMPSLPPPSSRFSEHMRQVQAAEGPRKEDAPAVPSVPDQAVKREAEQQTSAKEQPKSTEDGLDNAPTPQAKTEDREAAPTEEKGERMAKKQAAPAAEEAKERRPEAANRTTEKPHKGPGLSAFPSIPPQPQYYARGVRGESPSNRPPMAQRPPPTDRRHQPPPRDSSPARRIPPGHPLHRPEYPPFAPGPRNAPSEPGPPRSRFYGRQSESANVSQTSLVEPARKPDPREREIVRGITKSPNSHPRTQSPSIQTSASPLLVQTPPVEQRGTPKLEEKSFVDADSHPQRSRNESDTRPIIPEAKPSLLEPAQREDLLKRPQSPANNSRAPSPSPSQRPTSAGDLLNKFSGDKSLPSLPPELGPRPTTPDAASVLTTDLKALIADPLQTLRDLTKQSEALHARHASLRADRLKLSTAISASLKDSKPGPEYANSLLDQHLSLNAINSSLDICFAKLKSLDCKKEEAIQALIEQTKEKLPGERRHRATASLASHSTQASISGHSSKASTPDIGPGPLPSLQERDSTVPSGAKLSNITGLSPEKSQTSTMRGQTGKDEKTDGKAPAFESNADNERLSFAEGLPTPRAIIPGRQAPQVNNIKAASTDVSRVEKAGTSPQAKRNTMVKMPSISPAPSLFTKEPFDMSPVSPIEANDDDDAGDAPKRLTIKGAKAAKILGLVAGQAESPSGITLPDASPTESRGSPAKEFAVELKIHRKPVPGAAKASGPPPPARQAPMPPQPGRKRTNDSASTVQTDSSPESEVRTPRGSQDGMVPRGLKVGKKHRPQQPVQVVNDDDILDYYAR